jgi:hypothetical protein
VGFALDPKAAEHSNILGKGRYELIQQACLAAPGLSQNHDDAAVSRASSEDEILKLLQLGISSQQHAGNTSDTARTKK